MALDDFDTEDSMQAQAVKPALAPVPALVPAPIPAPVPAPAVKVAKAGKAGHSEDEDLFDFPVIEMKLEAELPKKPAAGKPAAPAPAAAPAAKAAPVAAPAPAKETAKPASPEVRPQDKKDVAKAAQLVDDIEQVLGSERKPHKRAKRLQGPSALTLVGIGVLLLTNVFGLLFLSRTSESVENGVQAMNRRFAESLRLQSQAQSQPAPVPQPGGKAVNAGAPAPLETFELTALQMAREEIQAGEYAAARRRLSRLLAAADRIEVGSRADIEAQASFLVAATYRKQAEAAREKSP